ncbi:tRNA (adenosine(37)-N6)-threonylcarbamoyltransferase complex transferase subunit TsaD [Candidatus Bipolaricaulota bacterium]|nr:tRNA (adenosine(37)-N6)-threonylcarbamoyltransferase complex transferase subunit TsaD [Candidatus Bipolaricaulota bacterium]
MPSPHSALTLAIETSCDETAVAIVRGSSPPELVANLVYSQAEIHAKFGGVIPEVASRNHLRKLPLLVRDALSTTGISSEDIGLVASTYGPGLVGPLLVGLSYAKGFAYGADAAFIGINHLEGHLFAHRLAYPDVSPPFMGLIVSGGHTLLIRVDAYGRYTTVGTTVDDAAGEALDKVGKKLGIPYPAGAELDRRAQIGNPTAIVFPRPMAHVGFDFSFSGLKTSVMTYLRKQPHADPNDVAASFVASVVDVLATKSVEATHRHHLKNLVVVGGVAASATLRTHLEEASSRRGIRVWVPPLALCTDNAAMIAAAAAFRHYEMGQSHNLSLAPEPNLGLDVDPAFRSSGVG